MNDAFDGLVYAPWDADTVDALTDFQDHGMMHPYTCPRDHYRPDGRIDRGERVLEATEAGWICPEEGCGYTQRWAHAFSADREIMDRHKAYVRKVLGSAS